MQGCSHPAAMQHALCTLAYTTAPHLAPLAYLEEVESAVGGIPQATLHKGCATCPPRVFCSAAYPLWGMQAGTAFQQHASALTGMPRTSAANSASPGEASTFSVSVKSTSCINIVCGGCGSAFNRGPGWRVRNQDGTPESHSCCAWQTIQPPGCNQPCMHRHTSHVTRHRALTGEHRYAHHELPNSGQTHTGGRRSYQSMKQRITWNRPWLADTKNLSSGTRCASQRCPTAFSRYCRVGAAFGERCWSVRSCLNDLCWAHRLNQPVRQHSTVPHAAQRSSAHRSKTGLC